MAREARKISNNGIYHVVFRGINKADVFLDDEDHLKLLYIIKDLQDKEPLKIYAYCIMPNHVHILMQDKDNLSELMKRMLSRYVIWYNKKYERVGHLFQNRFFSHPVETEAYFLAALQYIYLNPVKGGIVQHGLEYKWSSFCQWFWQVRTMPDICVRYDKLPVKPHMLDTKLDAKNFELFDSVTDMEIRRQALDILKLERWQDVQDIGEEELRKCVEQLLHNGAKVRAIARIFGLTRFSVNKIVKELSI